MRPLRYAALLAGSYLLIGAAYIVVSTQLSADTAVSKAELAELETIKGVLYMVVTAVGVFFIARALFGRLQDLVSREARQQNALRAAEHRATAGLFAASVAHDFNNLLTVATLLGRELASGESPDPESDFAELQSVLDKASGLARQLARAGRERAAGDVEAFDLVAEVEATLSFARLHQRAKHCAVQHEHPPRLELRGHASLVDQLVLNLVLNACEAGGAGTQVVVVVEALEGGGASLTVHDNGPGIPPDVREQIYDPFFTTKREGTGLGMLSARTCAEIHGGELELGDSERLGGAMVRATFFDVPTEGEETASAA